jgi:hypothetical protein
MLFFVVMPALMGGFGKKFFNYTLVTKPVALHSAVWLCQLQATAFQRKRNKLLYFIKLFLLQTKENK